MVDASNASPQTGRACVALAPHLPSSPTYGKCISQQLHTLLYCRVLGQPLEPILFGKRRRQEPAPQPVLRALRLGGCARKAVFDVLVEVTGTLFRCCQ